MKVERSRIRKLIGIFVIFMVVSLLLTFQFYLEMKKGISLYPINLVVFLIVNINLIVIVILFILIARTIIKAYMARKRGLVGASFRFKVILSFIGVSLVPAVFLLVLSVGFIHKSLSNWFSSRIHAITDSSVELSRAYIEEKNKRMSLIAEDVLKSDYNTLNNLEHFLNKYGLMAIWVYNSKGGGIGVERKSEYKKEVDVINSVREAFESRETSVFYSGRYYFYIKPFDGRVLVIVDRLPKDISKGLGYIESIYREFMHLNKMRVYIEKSYVYTFLFIMLIVIFASMWFGLQLAKSVVEPIELLILATKEVSKGNFSFTLEVKGEDELATLVKSFNEMVLELGEKTRLLEERRKFIETIVESVSSGIISLDKEGRITIVNSAFMELFGMDCSVDELVGKKYYEVFSRDNYRRIYEVVVDFLRDRGLQERRPFVASVDMEIKDEVRNLFIKVNSLKSSYGNIIGFLIVIDDVTELTKAQRALVWEEVARRLAHEIKNPLTPIKLSAQRLLKKYLDRVDDKESFSRIVNTIVRSVDSMRRLIDEFYRFARMPEVKFGVTNLVSIVKELVELYSLSNKNVEFNLLVDSDFPEKILADGEQLRRALINILDNAIHAMYGSGRVDISLKYDKERNMIVISIADTGVGIPDEEKEKIFAPYYSKKDGGIGLGLTITDRIIADHGGYISVSDNYPRGAIFTIEIPYRGV
ncbi:MAG: ATP-binding protein [Thermosulfidibacteraceae bacterium]|jgi:two-component system nitrogen regulation sensor histidine kinase NtrY